MTTRATLRSRWTKAESVCHVRRRGDGASPTSPLKDTRLLGVGSSAWLARARTPLLIGPDILAYLAVLLKTKLAINIAPHG